jgi:hypothetical protein
MKKKLLWKFNIVDIFIILLIIAIIAFVSYKIIGTQRAASSKEMGTMTYVVKVSGMEKSLYDNIVSCLPSQMANSGAYIYGDVVSAEYEPCDLEYEEVSSPVNYALKGYVKVPEDREYVTAYFTCSARVDFKDLLNMVGTQEIRLGRSYYVKGVDFEVVGTIISFERLEND